MSDTYYQKYLKYKNKYLELKNSLESNQTGGMQIREPTGRKFVDPNPRSDFTTLPTDKIPKENMDTQRETGPYGTVCASQNPILCGTDSKNAGYCVKTEKHCDANNFLTQTYQGDLEEKKNYMLNKEDYKASYNPKLYNASDFTKGQVTGFASDLLSSVSKFVPLPSSSNPSPSQEPLSGKRATSSSPTNNAALKKEIDDLKAKNAELQKSSDESNKKKQEVLDIVSRLINYFGFKVRTAPNNNLLFLR